MKLLRNTFTNLTFNIYFDLFLRSKPWQKLIKPWSFVLMNEERKLFSSRVKASPSVNQSGWYKSFSKEISFISFGCCDFIGLYIFTIGEIDTFFYSSVVFALWVLFWGGSISKSKSFEAFTSKDLCSLNWIMFRLTYFFSPVFSSGI